MARARGTLYPYPTLEKHLVLSYDPTSLPETVVSGPPLTLDACDQEGAFPLELSVTAPGADIAKQLEINDPADLSERVKMVVVGRSNPSRFRWEIATRAVDKLGESETILLDPDNYRGRLDIQGFLVYLDGEDRKLKNCRCGESEILSIYFDDYDSPPGSDIPSRWVDFTDPVNLLTDRAEQLFVVRADSEPPLLLLNSSIDEFKRVMSTGAQHGPKQRIRDSVCHRIACQTWQAILSNTLEKLSRSARAADDSSVADLLALLTPWRANLIAGFVGDDGSEGAFPNVEKLIDDLENDPDRVLVEEATNWVQQHLLKREPFQDLMKFLEV